MKVVIDSNVIIAAFATRGICQSIFEAAMESSEVIISKKIINEVKEKLSVKIKLPQASVTEAVEYLNEFCVLTTFEKSKKVCRDEKDNHILWLAESSKAEYIITGDEDLKVLKKHKITQIVSPRGFWFVLSGKKR
ncbi:MAG: putative toxin-antitoxin system toxin component, PIN family [Candidatus Firestonebacteria bacterium RIFOXYC2_FULL_39_67]|nr:MAG: putative toxin-antitoxin system toxin component, PIN family [Candidatus Firestonebacteria bacterium RIFOXYD2_FULL_39_29]OGF54159.1 MAG: putative toxin-antitoxin system toxin component, PIN family [Candidatus Firestonebacteria bacterium RIFOXYC2_FULL_39_67]OGF57888.1 MAG: putative toxin-antitoxin system toxin component, PIN family [Candidatus Firestonebacteria bacterium RifOxyC12_full_39_7]